MELELFTNKMEIDKLLAEIIPPSDYEHRNGFSNREIIDRLNNTEKTQLEDALIFKLLYEQKADQVDTLIVETLTYLKSQKSLPLLYSALSSVSHNMSRLIIATCIFELSHDPKMVDVASEVISEIDKPNDPYSAYNLAYAFDYLARFKHPQLTQQIRQFVNHDNVIVSANAKRVLNAR